MSFSTTSVSVTTGGASLLFQPSTATVNDPTPCVIFNNDATNTVYIGGSGVTSGSGFPILKQTGISFKLLNSDAIYGIAVGGTIDVRVMKGRQ